MNLKKLLAVLLATLISCSAFAYMAPMPDDDPTQQFLQQYQQEMDKLTKQFDTKLLPPIQGLVKVVKTVQTDLTPEQEAQIDQFAGQLDEALNAMVAPTLEQVDLEKLNTLAKQLDPNAQKIDKEGLSNILKTLYLIQALGHFSQNKKMSEEDVSIAMTIFFPEGMEEVAE